MDEEKLIELKKVFADVIFNITKEAAARVKSSEIKAAQYQHKLNLGTEEGVRLLVNIKQMMEFKIHQSNISSQNQQKKIDELEAQLNEAEDIVKDLRDELGEVQSELERLKKDNLQHSNEPTNSFSREMESGIYSNNSNKFLHSNSQDKLSDITMLNPSQRNECCKCNSETVCTCGSYVRDRDLPSMSLRGKEAGLYRNGFTQRIHACESKLKDKSSSHLVEIDKVIDENIIRELTQRFISSREQEEGEDMSKEPATGTKTLNQVEKKNFPDNEFDIFQSFPFKRKRATRVRKTVTPLSESKSETALMFTEVKTETPTRLGTNLLENFGDIILQKNEGLKETIVPFEDETGFEEILSSPERKIDVDSNGLEPIYSPSVGKRVIKYTFQRKRKRDTLSGSNMPDVEIETEEKMGVEQNGDKHVEKSKTMESSRESRRLAQVARQLISLSEKKRWD
ncbi:hypothetical protein CASFOL_015616 [Castilleja foliolosa]|uniref:Uncharacterized protein n=1 Tax=Castilleja foliolosa TaxID=1961234 RepID=A0ABD3DE64_9LAMI